VSGAGFGVELSAQKPYLHSPFPSPPNHTTLTFEQILEALKQKQYKPVYFLHGEEAYFIDALSDYIEKEVLSEGEKAFNQTVLYGKEADHMMVTDVARRYPMMAPYQVVVLKEAQDMKSLKELQGYLEKPSETTILVICHKHGKYNLNSNFGKAVKEKAVVFESKPLYDNQVPEWIRNYLRRYKLPIKPAAADLIAEYLGTDLSKVANELDKMAINLPQGTEISEQQVEQHIGISKDYNIFELQKALGQRDVLKANRIVQYFMANPKKNPMPVVLSSLYGFFSKIYVFHFAKNLPEAELLRALQLRSAWFLKDYREAAKQYNLPKAAQIIGLLKEYDLKSKGVHYNATGKPEGELLRELIWKVLHIEQVGV